jgi:hypothetical protein
VAILRFQTSRKLSIELDFCMRVLDGNGSLIPCSFMHIQFSFLCNYPVLILDSDIDISFVMPCAKRERASMKSEPPTLELYHHHVHFTNTPISSALHPAKTTFMEGSSSNTCHPSSSPAM